MNKIKIVNSGWIENQIEYRFADIRKTRIPLLHEYKTLNTNNIDIKSLSLLITSERRFSALNSFDKLCSFDSKQGFFIKPKIVKGRRQARFANLAISWRFDSPFLSNWCDAQGWNYKFFPELNDIPIMQFSRRKKQRGSVVLFPLDSGFMGPGGKNIPLNFDPISFRNKKDSLVWRGRYTGTSCDWESDIFWSESLVKKNDDVTNESIKTKHINMPRYQVIKNMKSVNWADLGFSLRINELNNIKISRWKSDFLFPYIKPRLTLANQIKSKFILAMPGNDYPTSLYWSLHSNSVVFLLENEWETALDSGLEPWIHYVPVKPSREDIEEKFEQMVNKPKLCLEIIDNAHHYMQPFLNQDLRDAADYETLRHYQDLVIPVFSLDKRWSFSRSQF